MHEVVSYPQPLMSRNSKEIVFCGSIKLLNLFIDLHTPNMPQIFTINNSSYKDMFLNNSCHKFVLFKNLCNTYHQLTGLLS